MQTISRSDARAIGLTLFQTNEPCPHGNLVPRRVGNGACTCEPCQERQREHQRRYRKQHPEVHRAQQQIYRARKRAAQPQT